MTVSWQIPSFRILGLPTVSHPHHLRPVATTRSRRWIRVAMQTVDTTVIAGLLVVHSLFLATFDDLDSVNLQGIRASLNHFLTGEVRVMTGATALVWISMLIMLGSYQASVLGSGSLEYKRVLTATMSTAATVAMSCYLFEVPLSRRFFLLLFASGGPLLISARFTLRKIIQYARLRGLLMIPVVVAGSPQHIMDVVVALHREPWLGYRVVGAVVPAKFTFMEEIAGVPVIGSLAQAAEAADRVNAAAMIFTEGSFRDSAHFRRTAWQFEEISTQMIVVPQVLDVSADRLAMRPVAGLPLVHVEPPQAIAAGRWSKRVFDLVGGLTLTILCAPIVLLVALAIKMDDGGPVFFRQERVGRGGRTFTCYKIRSMRTDAENCLDTLRKYNEGSGVLFKMTHDPRITRVGRFIRRFSIDEIPQFWNVVRGEMSLVGPRPALISEVQAYDEDTLRRLAVRPGVTGLWQVSGRSDLSWEETVRLDLYYCDNWSAVQDMMILARTAGAVLASRGAY